MDYTLSLNILIVIASFLSVIIFQCLCKLSSILVYLKSNTENSIENKIQNEVLIKYMARIIQEIEKE